MADICNVFCHLPLGLRRGLQDYRLWAWLLKPLAPCTVCCSALYTSAQTSPTHWRDYRSSLTCSGWFYMNKINVLSVFSWYSIHYRLYKANVSFLTVSTTASSFCQTFHLFIRRSRFCALDVFVLCPKHWSEDRGQEMNPRCVFVGNWHLRKLKNNFDNDCSSYNYCKSFPFFLSFFINRYKWICTYE